MKTSRSYRDIGMEEVCLACGKTYGRHNGLRCPTSAGLGHTADERFYSVVDCPAKSLCITGDPKTPIGPRKPVPAIPPEIHSSKPFDPQAAWEAVKALSKGS